MRMSIPSWSLSVRTSFDIFSSSDSGAFAAKHEHRNNKNREYFMIILALISMCLFVDGPTAPPVPETPKGANGPAQP